ncbi:hypothetical protein ACFY71_26180 [Streptomyces cinerochromogenes]
MLVEPDQQGLREISALIENGRLRVIVDVGETGRTTGKIVLTVASDPARP